MGRGEREEELWRVHGGRERREAGVTRTVGDGGLEDVLMRQAERRLLAQGARVES